MIRKATEKDVDTVAKLYEELHAYHDSHPNYCNWDRRIYPVRQTAEKAFRGGWLYVYENDAADYSDGQNENINENSEVSPQILGAVILNHIQPQEYAGMAWNIEAEAEDVFVIHTLCVSPRARKMERNLAVKQCVLILRNLINRRTLCIQVKGMLLLEKRLYRLVKE